MEHSTKYPAVVTDCATNGSKLKRQCCYHGRSTLRASTVKRRHKFSDGSKKSSWFARRPSKINLPTRFLLGGTICDPLNLEGLQKEDYKQSDSHSFETNGRVLAPKHLRRIGFPDIIDASDPLNLKSISTKDSESSSGDSVVCMEEKKNACCKSHCQSVLTSEDSSEPRCQCFCSSSDMKESTGMCSCNGVLILNSKHQQGVEVPGCSLNTRSTDGPLEEAASNSSSSVSNENISSVSTEVKTITCTLEKGFTGHEKIVSPAVPQFVRHQARKRQRRCSRASKETVESDGTADKSSRKKIKETFPCGNYVAYYGYRNVDKLEDPRLELLPKELFEGKDVLDIGCNAGLVTIAVASSYLPKRILGMDVDQQLIGQAKRNVRRYMDENSYPSCLKTAFGPIAASMLSSTENSAFPHNILFQVGDYVPSSEADLRRQCVEYDVILALSVTKWIHLTHGDAGLRRAFRRMFLQLRPGGKLFLEAQPWSSYKRKKKLTEKIYEVYQSICFKPEQFNDYLMSAEVGFSCCELLGTPQHQSKGFQRSIYLFTKADAAAEMLPA